MNALDLLIAAASIDGLATATGTPSAIMSTDWATGRQGTCNLYTTSTAMAHIILNWLGAENVIHETNVERVLPIGIQVRVVKARDHQAGNTTTIGLGVLGALARVGAEATELITESTPRGTVQGTIRVKTTRTLGDMLPSLVGILGVPSSHGWYAEWETSRTVIRVYDKTADILT